jgi:hypothetical protein
MPAKAFHSVIPAKAGIQFRFFAFGETFPFRHSSGRWIPFGFSLDFRVYAKTDSRPCVVPSAILAAGSLSLLAQRK